jgi:uncharacterized protein YndB with AHSA1/START domain
MWGTKKKGSEEKREISRTRVYSMSREAAWLFWGDPEMLRFWWLPEGARDPFLANRKNLLPGWWKREKEANLAFIEIERPIRLCFRCDASPGSPSMGHWTRRMHQGESATSASPP